MAPPFLLIKETPDEAKFHGRNIDISKPQLTKQIVTKWKAMKICGVRSENMEAEAKLKKLKEMFAGESRLLPHTPVLSDKRTPSALGEKGRSATTNK
jgi:hypothetical protein